MTIILNYLTSNEAIQVSDRQLTDGLTGRITSAKTPKTTVAWGAVAFGYSGLGDLGGEPTHGVLTTILSGLSDPQLNSKLQATAEELERLTALVRVPPQLSSVRAQVVRLAVVGVGFLANERRGPLRPVMISISNFGDPLVGWQPTASAFQWRVTTLRDRSALWVAGVRVPREERREWQRLLDRRRWRRDYRRAELVALLIDFARSMAGPTVGRSLLVSSLPAEAIPTDVSIVLGPPDLAKPTFLYIPDSGYDGTLYAPNVAGVVDARWDISVSLS